MTFLANHYIWFLLITIVLLFALIGYFLDSKNEPAKKKKEELTEKMITDKIETLENKPLNEMVSTTPKQGENVPTSVAGDIPILMPEEKPVETFEIKND